MERAVEQRRIPTWSKWTALVVVLGAVAAVAFGPGEELVRELMARIAELGAGGAVVFFVAYVVATVAFVPGSILTVGAGFVFGAWWGTALVSVSSTVGALAAFFVGRYFARGWVKRTVADKPRFKALFRAMETDAFKIVLLARLVPLLPFNLLNYAFGVTDVDWRKYLAASWLGMLPATFAYVYAGAAAGTLARAATEQAPPDWATWGLWALGAGAVVTGTWLVTKRARAELSSALADNEPPREVPDSRDRLIEPRDEFDEELTANTHPPDRVNPVAEGTYNLVVIGGGTAGLVAAAGAAMLGARVALVERSHLGGDCLVHGCVPSKALLSAAGVMEFSEAMRRMRRLRAKISHHDSAERFTDLGVEVHFGDARFLDERSVAVGGQRLRFQKAVIATGSRPAVPDIPGLSGLEYLTNETVFELEELPESLVVIGGGPIGCELAQAFARFGCRVTLLEREEHILPSEDPQAAKLVARALQNDGVELMTSATVTEAREGVLTLDDGAKLRADAVLVAVGRVPSVEGLGLDHAGVEFDGRGVKVDDRLRTSQKHIFASGDVASSLKFTHVADAMSKIVLRNALFFGRQKFSDVVVPRVTYTDPELAHVGLSEREARAKGMDVDVMEYDFEDLDRAILEEAPGLARVILKRGTDEILGASVVARSAGEMITQYTLAIKKGLGLATLSHVVQPYPTQAEGLKKPADEYNRGRLKPWMKRWLQRWFEWRR